MVRRTIVSVYDVDEAGMTGARVGVGSLVAPRGVLIHPPLSNAIADGHGPRRLRLGIHSEPDGSALVEVIDGREEPRVLGVKEGVGPLVCLELRTEAALRIDVMNGIWAVTTMEDLVELAVPVLASSSTDGWNEDPPPDPANNPFCMLLRWMCHERD